MRFGKKLFFGLHTFFNRLQISFKLMSKLERRLAFLLIVLAVTALLLRAREAYVAKTVIEPSAGGEYTESIAGDLKYLNPILVQSDNEKSSSRLIFSSLCTATSKAVVPNVAEKWEVSPDGKKYTFTLRKDAVFHDGVKLTANDVNYTINLIKTVNADGSKSPLYDAWKDVSVTVLDDYHINFDLPKSYGPFIYNTTLGILPSHVSPDDLARKFTGSGPFIYESMSRQKDGSVVLKLRRNDSYYGEKAHFDRITLRFYAQSQTPEKVFSGGDSMALFGTMTSRDKTLNLSYKSARQLGLIFNLRNDKLKDKEVRRKMLSGERFPDGFKVRLVTLDAALQRDQAEEIKRRFQDQNIQLDTIYLNPIQLQDVLASHEFELLLYGFDFGYDRDPYVFWHSSQINALNFAGYSDKQSDILLEDARMITDPVERNKRYDQFFDKLRLESLAEFYDPIKYNFYVDSDIKGLDPVGGIEASSRYAGITSWYVNEKRVKK